MDLQRIERYFRPPGRTCAARRALGRVRRSLTRSLRPGPAADLLYTLTVVFGPSWLSEGVAAVENAGIQFPDLARDDLEGLRDDLQGLQVEL